MTAGQKRTTVALSCVILAAFSVLAELACDFEAGVPADWTLTKGRAELRTHDGNTALQLGDNALMTLGDAQPLNFALEAVVRREYDASTAHVGFQFRNGYRAYIRRPGQVELTGPNGAKALGFTRNMATYVPLTFRIVVAGPVVRFFVNGQYEGQFSGLDMTPGPLALYQNGAQHNVYFDNVKLETDIEPAQFLTCDPELAADQALVFDPAEDVALKVRLTNHADAAQTATLGIEVSTFDGKPVVAKTMPPASLDAGASRAVAFALGRLPEGYYRAVFQPTGEMIPLAVHVRGTVTHDQIVMPALLTGVYWYYWNWNLPPVWANTYMHAACADLRRHGFNTIICAIGMPTDMIEIASQYGIRCFTRGMGAKDRAAGFPDGNVAHPNVIGGFIGDEPHKGQEEQYITNYTAALEGFPDKIWTTCMIGDGGVDGCQPWWDAWTALPGGERIVRMMRWYGIKNYIVGIERTYGTMPPLTETLRNLSRGTGPYYFIMPSFGNPRNVDAYYSNPLPSQSRCMMHLAAAFQAKGLFFWTYQTPFPDHDALVDPVSLMPLDGKWAAIGEAARAIQKNAELLADCTWAGRYRFVDAPALLEVFELRRKDDPARYFYAINTDTRQAVSGRLFKLDAGATLHDLFADRPVPVVEETVVSMRSDLQWVGGVAKVDLQPGDAVLLRLDPAATADGEAVLAAMPRVAYPDAVANAPEAKVVWLADVEPVNMPVPGWFPAVKYKGKKWYPDFHAHDLRLYSGPNDAGQLYEKSLYAHAETRIVYDIPEGAAVFAAAAGFGNKDEKSSAIFRVLVDGKEKYNSGLMKVGSPVQAVVVDVAGATRLELVTEEAGDGLYGDYTFWGEARLITK